MSLIQFVRSIRAAAALSASMTVAMWAADSQAQVLGPATVNDFVTLHDTPGAGWCEWVRKTPTGPGVAWTPSSTTALVITSVQWHAEGATPDIRYELELIRGTGSAEDPIGDYDRVYQLLALVDGGRADAYGHVGAYATFPTGVVVAPRAGSQFCAYVNGPSTYSVRVTVQGYLVALVRRAD